MCSESHAYTFEVQRYKPGKTFYTMIKLFRIFRNTDADLNGGGGNDTSQGADNVIIDDNDFKIEIDLEEHENGTGGAGAGAGGDDKTQQQQQNQNQGPAGGGAQNQNNGAGAQTGTTAAQQGAGAQGAADTDDFAPDDFSAQQDTVAPEILSKAYEAIARKLGHEGKVENDDQFLELVLGFKADMDVDSNERANVLADVLEKNDNEQIVRFELNANREKYGILSDSDIDDRIAKYTDSGELEKVATGLKTAYTGEIKKIHDEAVAAQRKNHGDYEAQVKQNAELTNKILEAADTYDNKIISSMPGGEKNMKAIREHLKSYIENFGYQEDVVGVKTLTENPAKAIENAMWVNQKTRNYMLGQIIKQAVEQGKSDFIKENLFGKTPFVGKAPISVPRTQKDFTTDDDNLDV